MKVYKSWPGLTLEDTNFARSAELKAKKIIRSWMHEDIQDRDSLLITVGDSWTWGDSLLNIEMFSQNYDHPDRVKVIYGATLAKMLDSDFVNVGDCGGHNLDMFHRLSNLLSYNNNKYKQIYVVVTLTENCRELGEMQTSKWSVSAKEGLHHFLQNYERRMFIDFKMLFEKYSNVKFLIGRNFTYSYDENISILEQYHLDKTWVDCLNEHVKYPYPKDVRFVTTMVIKPIQTFMKRFGFFDVVADDMLEEFKKIDSAIDWFEHSSLNYRSGYAYVAAKATKHPTIEGHNVWANYLYENIANK